MLSGDELSWLNDYHDRVRHAVRPHVDEATKALARRGDRAAVRFSYRRPSSPANAADLRTPRIRSGGDQYAGLPLHTDRHRDY